MMGSHEDDEEKAVDEAERPARVVEGAEPVRKGVPPIAAEKDDGPNEEGCC